MFTGLIETTGQVIANHVREGANRLLIDVPLSQLKAGESIAVNGVCLTLLPDLEPYLAFDVSSETLKLTTLGTLCIGDCVNIERSLLASSRLGGNFVSGHVDTTACLHAVTNMADFIEIIVNDFGANANHYLFQKGSITLDGVNLTINEVNEGSITVMLVPHTLAVTTLKQWRVGQRVNVEFDYLTRIVAKQFETFVNSQRGVIPNGV